MALFGGITLPGRPDLENQRRLDTLIIPPINRMMRCGITLDKPWMADLSSRLGTRMDELRREIIGHIPEDNLDRFLDDEGECEFNVNSSTQIADLLFKVLGVGRGMDLKTTKDGNRISTGKKQLEALKKEHQVIPLLLEYREAAKLKTTYTDNLPNKARWHEKGDCVRCGLRHAEGHWRVHSRIVSTRTDTGRLACVAPWTPIKTPNGEVTISDLQIGDSVWTHLRRWRKVTGKYMKGVERMYSVRFSNGEILTCTGYHRLLVLNHGSFKEMDSERAEPKGSGTSVSFTGVSNNGDDSSKDEYPGTQCLLDIAELYAGGRKESSSSDSLFTLETGREESNAGQNQREASQLDRSGGRWVRVSDLLKGWQAAICPQDNNGRGSRIRHTAKEFTCPPHRPRQKKQQPGQFSAGYYTRSQKIALPSAEGQQSCFIQEISLAGSYEVYDISVDEDESYAACGVFSHNSRSPNLQNLPARSKLGQEVRKGFVAEPGKLLVSRDFAQIELRLLADRADELNMIRIFNDDGDIHVDTAMRTFNIKDPKKLDKTLHRAPCKILNFGICYGLTAQGLYDNMLLTFATAGADIPGWFDLLWCENFIEQWYALYPAARDYFDLQRYRARRYGISWSRMGGVRRIPEVESVYPRVREAGLRQAGNNAIQRYAAEVFKVGMCRTHAAFERWREYGVGIEMLLPVHDELICEVDADWAEDIEAVIAGQMDQALTDVTTGVTMCRVPIKTDGSVMERWTK